MYNYKMRYFDQSLMAFTTVNGFVYAKSYLEALDNVIYKYFKYEDNPMVDYISFEDTHIQGAAIDSTEICRYMK